MKRKVRITLQCVAYDINHNMLYLTYRSQRIPKENQECTIQRNWQHRIHKAKKNKTKTQHNMCWTPRYPNKQIYRVTPKKTEPLKMLINPKQVHQISSNLVDLNFSLWMIFQKCFSHLGQFAYNFYVLSKMCSKWHPRR